MMLHYVVVNREFNEPKSMILLNRGFRFQAKKKEKKRQKNPAAPTVAGGIRPCHRPQNKTLQERRKNKLICLNCAQM